MLTRVNSLEHDEFSWNQLNSSCLLQHAQLLRANATRWNRERFHLVAFRSNAQPYPDSTPRILNYTTYTVVWLALSLHPIDRKSASP